MSGYQVLARSCRPQKFSEIVGQDHINQTLTNIISSERIGQAYLFAGTRGVGKTSFARIFAKALNCSSLNGVEPCNECVSCAEISKSGSIDVMEIDGASNNGVDSIRDLREQVGYMPTSGKFKIYIIDEVHMLTGSAFNALLKTLEEPPAHVIFIFATTEVHKIPPTILSRCQRFNFRKVSRKEIADHLSNIVEKEKIAISPSGINLIAKEANGSIRDSLSLLEQVISFGGKDLSDTMVRDAIGLVDHGLVNKALKGIFAHDANELLEVVKAINEFGFDFKTFLTSLISQMRNVLVIKLHETQPSLNEVEFSTFLDLPDEEVAELKEIAASVADDRFIHRMFAILNDSIPVIQSSVLPLMTLETVLLRMASSSDGVSAEVLMKRIEGLERRVMNSSGSVASAPAPSRSESYSRPASPQFEQKSRPVSSRPREEAPIAKPKPKSDVKVSASITSDEVSSWESLVSAVKKKKPLLAANLEEGTVVEISKEKVKLVYSGNAFSFGQISEACNKKEIETILSSALSSDFKLEVLEGNPDDFDPKKKINLQQIRKQKQDEGISKIRDEAENHPNVNAVKDLLGGEIVDIKIKKD